MSNAYTVPKRRRSISTWLAFAVGLPAGVALLAALPFLPLDDYPVIARYTQHPVEQAELILFCIALGALIGKLIGHVNDRAALLTRILPAWNGEPQSIATASELRQGLEKQPGNIVNSYLGQRVLGILDFVESRGAANELDDHLRTQTDNDGLAMEGSYGLLRFITWAIPILGFLGTVLGITGAISNITPEVLEKSLSGVTDGLATAFDTTALALILTMVIMFCSFIMERLEQSVLDQVDHYVDLHLAHRFERTGTESGQFVEALRRNTQVLVKATETLVDRQVSLWASSIDKADRIWNETGEEQQRKISEALTGALERTLSDHTHRMIEMEEQLAERTQSMFQDMSGRVQVLLDGIQTFSENLRDSGKQHQETLAELTSKITSQTEALTQVQEGEANLVRLQEVMQQNLSALAGAGSFEQAVQSLTAAIHLLTTRVNAVPTTPVNGPRLSNRAA